MGVIVQTVLAPRLSAAAVEAMAEQGQQLIDDLHFEEPIECTLCDAAGESMGRFALGSEDPSDVT